MYRYTILEKIGNIEMVEITKDSKGKKHFVLKFFLFKANEPDRIELESIEPVTLDSEEEIRGFLKGFAGITRTEFYVTELTPDILQLTSWAKIHRSEIEVCFIKEKALTPQNLPNSMFESSISKSPLSPPFP